MFAYPKSVLSVVEGTSGGLVGFGGKACQGDEDGHSQRHTKDCGGCSGHGGVRLCSFSEPAYIYADLHKKGDISTVICGGRKEAIRPGRQH